MADSAVPRIRQSLASDAVCDMECTPCSAEGQHKEAESYCLECATHLCGQCVRYHQNLPSLKHHRLVNNDATISTLDSQCVRDVCTERCPEHKNETLKFFCPDHSITACVLCVPLEHQRCGLMEFIEDAAPGLEDRQDFMEFTATLDDLTQQSEDTVNLALKNTRKSTDCHTRTMQELDAYEEELVSTVHCHVEAIRDQAGQIHVQDTDKMDKLISQGNNMLTELRAVASNVHTLRSKKQFCKLFVEMKQKHIILWEMQRNIESMGITDVTAYRFQPDKELRKVLGCEHRFGKLIIGSSLVSSRDTMDSEEQEDGQHNENAPASDDKSPKASHLIDINVKSTSNTKPCAIYGMTILPNDNLVVADWKNCTIKLIDTANNAIVFEHMPEKAPFDVSSCKYTIAATLPAVKKIVFLEHASGLILDWEISVNGQCRGIDWKDDKLYVVYDEEQRLEIMTTTGVVLHTFFTTANGQQLFQDPTYVTMNAVNQRIYVSEWGLGRLIVLDMDGIHAKTYEDDEMGSPDQLAVAGSGAMFLCDNNTSTLHLLSPAGQKLKILLGRRDGLALPMSVAYSENNGRLYVGMVSCDVVKVYQLS